MSVRNTNDLSTEAWEDTREVTRRFAAAVRDALREHKRASNPVAVWQDGKVVMVPPEEIPDAAESMDESADAPHEPQEAR